MEQKKNRKPKHPAMVYLAAYPAMKNRLEDLQDELLYIRAAATRTTSRLTADKVNSTPSQDSMANAIIKGIETEERLQRTINNLSEALTVRLMLIEEMEDEWEKLVLTERYINGRSWNNVFKRIPYERAKIFMIHGQALEHFWEIYQKHQTVD